MFVSKAAVVGGGTMGGEIAQAIAAADIPVVVKDIDQEFVDAALEKARAVTEGQLARLVKKEKLTQEQADARLAEVMGRVVGTTTYEEFGDVDFVVEAVPERMEIKQAVFRELDAATPGHAILASNTSSLSVSEMGETTLRPDKVVGFHFFYPASIMPLVEVIAGEDTSEETATVAYNFAQAIKKQPIVCGEVPGFVVNRILMATIGEIWRAQEEQGLSIKAIDAAIAGAQLAPMGPFFLTDLLGLDTVLHVAEHLADSYGETFYVHEGLRQLVADGKLGAKSGGEGFFKDGEQNVPGEGEPDAEEMVAMFTCRALIESCLLVEEGVCSVRDIDLGIGPKELGDDGREVDPPQTNRRCHAQRAARGCVLSGDQTFCFSQFFQQPSRGLEVPLASLCERDRAGRPDKQLHTEVCFQLRDPPAHGGQRDAQVPRGSGEASCFDDGDERRHGFESIHPGLPKMEQWFSALQNSA